MKKIVLLLITLLLIISLVSCDNSNSIPASKESIVSKLKTAGYDVDGKKETSLPNVVKEADTYHIELISNDNYGETGAVIYIVMTNEDEAKALFNRELNANSKYTISNKPKYCKAYYINDPNSTEDIGSTGIIIQHNNIIIQATTQWRYPNNTDGSKKLFKVFEELGY